MHRRTACVVLSSMFMFCGALPARSESQPFVLPAFLEAVKTRSPQLLSRRAAERAAATHGTQAKLPDDPMVMVELWQVPTTADRLPLMVTLKQAFAWPGKLTARQARAELDRDAARLDTALLLQNLWLFATRAYFQYFLAHRSLAVQRENRATVETLLGAVDTRYRIGKAEFSERLFAQSTLSEQNTLLFELEQQRGISQKELLSLLGETESRELGTPITLPEETALPPADVLSAQAWELRVESKLLDQKRKQAQAFLRLAAAEKGPDLAVWGSYMKSLRGDMEQTFTVGIQSSLPSFSLFRSSAQTQEALALLRQVDGEQTQLRAELSKEVHAAYLRYVTTQKHLDLHRKELSPLSEQAVKAARAGYQTGRVPLSLFLEVTQKHLQHRLEAEKYLAELGLRRAELLYAAGQGAF